MIKYKNEIKKNLMKRIKRYPQKERNHHPQVQVVLHHLKNRNLNLKFPKRKRMINLLSQVKKKLLRRK